MLLCERALEAMSASAAAPLGVPPLPHVQPQPSHGPMPTRAGSLAATPPLMAPRPAVTGVPDYLLRALERAVAVFFPRRSTTAAAAALAVAWSSNTHASIPGVSAQAQPPVIRRRSATQVSVLGNAGERSCVLNPAWQALTLTRIPLLGQQRHFETLVRQSALSCIRSDAAEREALLVGVSV